MPGWIERIALTVGFFFRALYQDLTDSSSFERAKFWVKELRNLEEVSGQTSPEDQGMGLWWLCGCL